MATFRAPTEQTAMRPIPINDAVMVEQRSIHRYHVAKRVFDLSLAVLLLLITLPVWIGIAVAIKLDSRGPVLFRQMRVGRDGRQFGVYKFRSMHTNCDDSIHRRYVESFISNGAPSTVEGGKAIFKLRNDRRITRAGRLLRKTSLDELPNLLNVIQGEMSLVGPRPALPYEVERYDLWHLGRLAGLPGITGTWQVYGRSRVNFDQMVRMDINYLHRQSLWLDIKLLVLTVPAVLLGSGAE